MARALAPRGDDLLRGPSSLAGSGHAPEGSVSASGMARSRGRKMLHKNRRSALIAVAMLVVLAVTFAALRATSRAHANTIALKHLQFDSQGADNPAAESNEYLTAQQQFAEARTAPAGIVNPGAYSAAVGDFGSLPTTGGAWADITAGKYDADHPAYRDFYSNSRGGAGPRDRPITRASPAPSARHRD